MIAIVSIIVFKLIIDIEITNYLLLVTFTLLSSFILGNIGIIAGLWAEKFDHMATVTNFVIVPLSFLSGTFYSIERLPEIILIILAGTKKGEILRAPDLEYISVKPVILSSSK